MVVWGCGRAFLAMLSALQMRMVSLADEGDGSTGVQSASLDGASTVTLALIFGLFCSQALQKSINKENTAKRNYFKTV